jgi:hypothetical protein
MSDIQPTETRAVIGGSVSMGAPAGGVSRPPDSGTTHGRPNSGERLGSACA